MKPLYCILSDVFAFPKCKENTVWRRSIFVDVRYRSELGT